VGLGRAIGVSGKGTGPVTAVRRVFAAWGGRGDDIDLPPGFQCFGVDEHGRKLYGRFSGPPRVYQSFEQWFESFMSR
jgi:hypothetical protein